MLTSDKWRQVRPRDLRTVSSAVHLPQLKPEPGSSQGTSMSPVRRGGRDSNNHQLQERADTSCVG